jgi:hypothetical protein
MAQISKLQKAFLLQYPIAPSHSDLFFLQELGYLECEFLEPSSLITYQEPFDCNQLFSNHKDSLDSKLECAYQFPWALLRELCSIQAFEADILDIF